MSGRSAKLSAIMAGQCDRLATIEYTTTTKDAVGGDVPAWNTLTTCWVSLEPYRGAKNIFAQQLRPTISHSIFTPWFATPAVDASMRITFDSRYFNIQYILDLDNRHEFYEFWVLEGVANV